MLQGGVESNWMNSCFVPGLLMILKTLREISGTFRQNKIATEKTNFFCVRIVGKQNSRSRHENNTTFQAWFLVNVYFYRWRAQAVAGSDLAITKTLCSSGVGQKRMQTCCYLQGDRLNSIQLCVKCYIDAFWCYKQTLVALKFPIHCHQQEPKWILRTCFMFASSIIPLTGWFDYFYIA